MKNILISLIICFPIIGYAQFDSINSEILPLSIDSVEISLWEVHTKEMSISGYEEEYEKELDRVKLSDSDTDLLIKKLLKSSSYDQERALRYHYNLVFELFKDSSINTRITISTFTGNIDIENKSNNQIFRNNCSYKFGTFLIGLITKHGFLALLDGELDLEGITYKYLR